jgi:hypothetical protein
VEVLVVIALGILLWFAWQLYRAKKFTQFKKLIEAELKPQVVEKLSTELVAARNTLFPNTDDHIQASIIYWCQYKARILQCAFDKDIISEKWLKDTGNFRNCQHLFHVEQKYMHTYKNDD